MTTFYRRVGLGFVTAEERHLRAGGWVPAGEFEEVLAALRELVRLKDIEDHPGPLNPKSADAIDYRRSKPAAWAEACRIAAAAPRPHPPSNPQQEGPTA